MDYEEAYKSLIEELSQARNDERKGYTFCSVIDNIVPELKESEDERIRKAIGAAICGTTAETVLEANGVKLVDALAYLEKQKEQKPNPYTGTGFYYNGHHWGMCARDGGVEIIVDGKIRDRVSFESVNIESSNSVAKEMFIKALERAVEQTKKGYELTDCDKHSWWEDFKAYSGIKPAEWSEEDEKYRKILLLALNDHPLRTDELAAFNWLKSLRPQPQKLEDWTEEDERKYQCIRCILLTDVDKKVGSWKYSEILEWYEKRGIGRYTNSQSH